jgi:aldehyde:ferredoxin oxidoreductase
MVGDPPLAEGNVRDITVDYRTLIREFLQTIGWDIQTSVPSDETLQKLGMQFLADDMKKVNVPAV